MEFQAAVRRLVEQAAATGQVVIVGRGSPVVLAERRDVLRVKIVAPLPARLAYVTHREGLSEAQAAARIRQKEQERQRALRHAYGDRGDDAHLYDLVVYTGVLPLDSAVALIVAALADKGRQLGVPAVLGPGAGLAPYPAPPADFGPAGQPA